MVNKNFNYSKRTTFLMKKFNIRIIFLLAPLFLLWTCSEYFYRNIPNNYTLKKQYIEQHSNYIEVLLFGNSHCFYGLNPKYFSKKTFNFSNSSQTIYFDKLLFDQYFDKLPQLKQVVFCIEYMNLSQKDNTKDDVWLKYYYQQYMNLEVPIVSMFDLRKHSLSLTQSLFKTSASIFRYYENKTLINCNPDGWSFNHKKINSTPPEKNAKQRASIHEDGSINFLKNLERIRAIIDVCEKRNIQLVIISMPQSKSYTSYLNKEKLQLIFSNCKNLENFNKNSVYYLNLFKDNRFIDEDFFDADHLNDNGAKKCSQILNEFLNKITVEPKDQNTNVNQHSTRNYLRH